MGWIAAGTELGNNPTADSVDADATTEQDYCTYPTESISCSVSSVVLRLSNYPMAAYRDKTVPGVKTLY